MPRPPCCFRPSRCSCWPTPTGSSDWPTLIRGLAVRYAETRDRVVLGQIENLRHRLTLIRQMQSFAVIGIFGCVSCMLVLFAGWQTVGKVVFAAQLAIAAGLARDLVPRGSDVDQGTGAGVVHLGKPRPGSRPGRGVGLSSC